MPDNRRVSYASVEVRIARMPKMGDGKAGMAGKRLGKAVKIASAWSMVTWPRTITAFVTRKKVASLRAIVRKGGRERGKLDVLDFEVRPKVDVELGMGGDDPRSAMQGERVD